MIESGTRIAIPARRGKAARVREGQVINVINTHGQQVVDTWAFSARDLTEFMSMEHSRAAMGKIIPDVGDVFVTNRRRPVLQVIGDTTPGIHDTLIAACDRYRYELLGCREYHDNCADNLVAALRELGEVAPEIPSPLNLFMNIPVAGGRYVSFQPPVCAAGQYIAMRASMDLIIAFSACPQDLLPINGVDRTPTEAHFTVI
ncbi:MAG: urea carboxylase-associated family protein [Bacillati bacterium ANGP1]|uniref:Urea carboxylase-associated family protein n=1 Tax=Candidatus Segetimicrobium genomatis TaxID=2569760 RepID=A0A537J6F2_9BACT|nr:MAG: urea carboxylase-associated family protein [Terrabacteria group bacterium ANGP1]